MSAKILWVINESYFPNFAMYSDGFRFAWNVGKWGYHIGLWGGRPRFKRWRVKTRDEMLGESLKWAQAEFDKLDRKMGKVG